jgi:predicted LPLAT superfamily acyltransferase
MERAVMAARTAGPSRHWAQIDEVSFVAGMRLLFWLGRVLGRWPFRIVLYPVLIWYAIAKPWARRASQDFLRRMANFDGAAGVDPGVSGVLRHFASFGECILDKLLLWCGLFDTSAVAIHGVEQIAAQAAGKRGGLIICCHFGNLELCRVMSKRQPGVKLTVLLHTKHATRFNRLLAQVNPDSQLNIMQVTELTPATAALLQDKIDQGEFIAIAGDRIPVALQPRVAYAPFLGAMAPFPVGPYVMASLFQCPVYLLFSLRSGRGWEIHFELFRQSIRLPRQDRSAVLDSFAAAYANRLESYCRQAPLQWFNFYDFWQVGQANDNDATR